MSYNVSTPISWARTQQDLDETFSKWGVKEWTTNYPRGARLTGFNQTIPDKAVTLTYVKNGVTINLHMDKQRRAVDNLRVLYLAVEDMRMLEKRGLHEVVESAYLQLAGGPSPKDPYEVLGTIASEPLEIHEAVYRTKAARAHPDKGGSIEVFKELTEAIKSIRKEKQNG